MDYFQSTMYEDSIFIPVPVGFVSSTFTEAPLSIGKSTLSISPELEIISTPLLATHLSKANSVALEVERYEH